MPERSRQRLPLLSLAGGIVAAIAVASCKPRATVSEGRAVTKRATPKDGEQSVKKGLLYLTRADKKGKIALKDFKGAGDEKPYDVVGLKEFEPDYVYRLRLEILDESDTWVIGAIDNDKCPAQYFYVEAGSTQEIKVAACAPKEAKKATFPGDKKSESKQAATATTAAAGGSTTSDGSSWVRINVQPRQECGCPDGTCYWAVEFFHAAQSESELGPSSYMYISPESASGVVSAPADRDTQSVIVRFSPILGDGVCEFVKSNDLGVVQSVLNNPERLDPSQKTVVQTFTFPSGG